MKKIRIALLVITSLVIFSSCGLWQTRFSVIDKTHRVKPAKLAVISATDHEAPLLLAVKMTEELKKQSRFRLMSQGAVKRAFPSYPFKVKGPFRETYTKTVTDFSKTDKRKISLIARKLGVQYLYVLWVPSVVVYNDSVNMANVYHQLFAFPGCREVGNGTYTVNWMKEGSVYIGSAPESYSESVDIFSKVVAEEITKKMGMTKLQNKKKK